MRSAVGAMFSRGLKVMRLGDNMRYVAVTEGDKIQAEKDFGWSVNTYGVGGFAEKVKAITDAQVDAKMANMKIIIRSKQMTLLPSDIRRN